MDFLLNRMQICKPVAALALLVFAGGAGAAGADVPTKSSPPVKIGEVAARYPSGSITTVARATAALADAKVERLLIEGRFASDQRACYQIFFVNHCLEQVGDNRRQALALLRPVEIEAGHTQRAISATDRDAAIAQRVREEALRAPQRAQSEKDYRNKQAARKAAPPPPTPDPQVVARSEAEFARRQAAHAAKLEQLTRQDAIKQEEAPAHIAAFKKKQRDTLTHQQDLARRKSEKMAREAQEAAQKDAQRKQQEQALQKAMKE
jgi:colicin import membrane protein